MQTIVLKGVGEMNKRYQVIKLQEVAILEVSFIKIKDMEKVNTTGIMANLILVIGGMGKRKGPEFGNQAKEIAMLGNGNKERSMGMEIIRQQTTNNMLVIFNHF